MFTAPALRPCAEVFKPGKPIRVPYVGPHCVDPDGTMVVVGAWRCLDGRHLWSVRADSGAQEGYGFDGEPYHAEKRGGPGYSAAYDKCHGTP